jgi:hypothetical protein
MEGRSFRKVLYSVGGFSWSKYKNHEGLIQDSLVSVLRMNI